MGNQEAAGRNFDWPHPEGDGSLNILDIVQSIGFLGSHYMLDGIKLVMIEDEETGDAVQIHNMTQDINEKEGGGVENIAAAINAIVEGEPAANLSYATDYCDVEW